MDDYHTILSRAVDALDPNLMEERRALYDRARRGLVEHLRATGRSGADAAVERAALEAAIQRVETDAMHPRSPRVSQETNELIERAHAERAQRRRTIVHVALSVVGAAAVAGLLVAGYGLLPRSRTAKQAEAPAARASYVYMQQPVYYRTSHPVGTIIVDKTQHFLYFVRPNVVAVRYGIGTGSECASAAGLYRVLQKEIWTGAPDPSGDERQLGALPRQTQLNSPLGARALRLEADYRIHGTDAPSTIGRYVRTGCFRLTNEDIIGLYDRVPIETRVVVIN